MKNIAIPGVFPLTIACMLALIAFRAHILGRQSGDKRYAVSKTVSIVGVSIFILMAVFEFLEANGVYLFL